MMAPTPPPLPSPPNVSKVIPFFRSTSIARTVAFYTSVLGFLVGGTHNHAPEVSDLDTFASLHAGDKVAVNIYFRTEVASRLAAPVGAGKAMVMCPTLEGLGEVWERVERAKGEGRLAEGEAGVVEAVEDKPWGYR